MVSPQRYSNFSVSTQLFLRDVPRLQQLIRPVGVHERRAPRYAARGSDRYVNALSRLSTAPFPLNTRPNLASLVALNSLKSLTSPRHLDGKAVSSRARLRARSEPILPSLCHNTPCRGSSENSLDMQMTNNLLMAEELHSKSLKYRMKAKGIDIADKAALGAAAVTKRPRSVALLDSLPPRVANPIEQITQSLEPLISYPERSVKKAKTASATLKKSRRKWLPSLGPPGTQSPSYSNNDWLYTSPEAFASLCTNKDDVSLINHV